MGKHELKLMNKKRYLSGDMGEGDSKGLEQKKLKKRAWYDGSYDTKHKNKLWLQNRRCYGQMMVGTSEDKLIEESGLYLEPL